MQEFADAEIECKSTNKKGIVKNFITLFYDVFLIVSKNNINLR